MFDYAKQFMAAGHRSFGIPETELIYAENLDIAGNDPQEIMDRAISALR